uniref:Cytochrome b6-f complex subunit 6 n=1 Tax=Rhexinema sarcinoideum TaxID=43261 RepID=A0A1B2RYK3_9CHLO|nr:subunit VI of cytochrome b6/f complex [Rhexinema sarcinoideum]
MVVFIPRFKTFVRKTKTAITRLSQKFFYFKINFMVTLISYICLLVGFVGTAAIFYLAFVKIKLI